MMIFENDFTYAHETIGGVLLKALPLLVGVVQGQSNDLDGDTFL